MTGIILKYRCPRRPGDVQGEPPLARRSTPSGPSAWSAAGPRSGAIDPGRIGMVGFSAGGHLRWRPRLLPQAALRAGRRADEVSGRPDFAVACYSGYLKPKDRDGVRSDLTIPDDMPPVFLAHASDDGEHHGGSDAENSVFMYLALKRAGVPPATGAIDVRKTITEQRRRAACQAGSPDPGKLLYAC